MAAKAIMAMGAGSIAAILFWMSLYLAGPVVLFPGVAALAVAGFWLTRRVDGLWALSERLLIAGLIAAQASLLSAAFMEVVPIVLERVI